MSSVAVPSVHEGIGKKNNFEPLKLPVLPPFVVPNAPGDVSVLPDVLPDVLPETHTDPWPTQPPPPGVSGTTNDEKDLALKAAAAERDS